MSKAIKHQERLIIWRQGRFVESREHRMIPQDIKNRLDYEEKFLVRPAPKGNAICKANTHGDAEWIAQQLNEVNERYELIMEFEQVALDLLSLGSFNATYPLEAGKLINLLGKTKELEK